MMQDDEDVVGEEVEEEGEADAEFGDEEGIEDAE